LVAAQVQDFGPAHATATTNFLAASTVDGVNKSDGSTSKFSDFGDSRSSVEWTEESSDEDLDYFAALDVAVAEASPRAADTEDVPGLSTGRRWRRGVAKRRVSGAEGGRLRVNRASRRLSRCRVWCPRLYMCKGLYGEVVCPRTFGYACGGVRPAVPSGNFCADGLCSGLRFFALAVLVRLHP
jgi:hypothetical protein